MYIHKRILLRKVCSPPVQTEQKVLPVQSLARNRHYSGPASGHQLQPQTDKTQTRVHRKHGAPLKGTRPTRQRCTRLMRTGAVPPLHYVTSTLSRFAHTASLCIYTEQRAWAAEHAVSRRMRSNIPAVKANRFAILGDRSLSHFANTSHGV